MWMRWMIVALVAYMPMPRMAMGEAIPPVPDLPVIDHHGVEHRLYSDLIKGKTVAINFLFTSCKTSCPAAAALFGGVHHRLRQGAGKDIQLLSLTVDPVGDRPEQLKAYAEKFGVGEGWTLLTGTQHDFDRLFRLLGLSIADKRNHSSMILILNDATGASIRSYGALSVPQVVERLLSVGGLPPSTVQAQSFAPTF